MRSGRMGSFAPGLLLAVVLVPLAASSSASPLWSWVGGAKTVNSQGVYTAPMQPGARTLAAGAVDASGHLFVFGGYGYGSGSPTGSGYLADLWQYDGSQWTCLAGNGARNTSGTYVAVGSAGVPSARQDAVMWADAQGAVWLFGGYGIGSASPPFSTQGPLNDLWRYFGGVWTWMGGSRYIADSGSVSYPGARSGAGHTVDSNGKLWMYGGSGMRARGASTTIGVAFGELWSFDGSTWTLRSGAFNNDGWGIYGTFGVPAASNQPGARTNCALSIGRDGHLWLYGGFGNDAGVYGTSLNDLWRYDGTTWTWIGGSEFGGSTGTFGTLGVPSPLNQPPAGSAVACADSLGDLWLIGPGGNDLWVFDGAWWTWAAGPSATGFASYGIKGVLNPANIPGRRSGEVALYSPQLGIRMFGGNGRTETTNGYLNDLWFLQPEVPAHVGLPPAVQFVYAPAEGDTVPYAQHIYWSGADPDGRIDHFEYAIDPWPIGVDTMWVRTTQTSSMFFFISTHPVEPVPLAGDVRCASAHTFILKGVDNEGLESARIARDFVTTTLAPHVWITSPAPDTARAITLLDGQIAWTGIDPDGRFWTAPVKYKYKLFGGFFSDQVLATTDFRALIRAHPDTLRKLYGSSFSTWDSLPGDTATARFSGLNRGFDYFLCVTGMDEDGAYAPEFVWGRNVIWFRAPWWTAVEGEPPPRVLELAVPEPNPARAASTLRFGLPRSGPARLVLYDAQGRKVRTLQAGDLVAGVYTARWDLVDEGGRRVHPGVYFARLEAGREARTRRLTVLE